MHRKHFCSLCCLQYNYVKKWEFYEASLLNVKHQSNFVLQLLFETFVAAIFSELGLRCLQNCK